MLDVRFVEVVDVAQGGQHLGVKHRRLGLGADVGGGHAGDEGLVLAHAIEPARPGLGGGQAAAALGGLGVAAVGGGEPQDDVQVRPVRVAFLQIVAQQQPLHRERRVGRLVKLSAVDVADPVVLFDGPTRHGVAAELARRPLLGKRMIGAMPFQYRGFEPLAQRPRVCHVPTPSQGPLACPRPMRRPNASPAISSCSRRGCQASHRGRRLVSITPLRAGDPSSQRRAGGDPRRSSHVR